MRWASWLLGIVGVAQYALIAYLQPTDYVSVDMAYLVMFGCVVAALFLGCCSWWGGYGCGCCGDDCDCGDCESCVPTGREHGHDHGPGEHGHAH